MRPFFTLFPCQVREAQDNRSVIYFIHGPDRLLAREAALSIAAEFDPDGSSTSWIDGREISIERIVAEVGTATFFGAPRVVIVSDLLARAGRDSGAAESIDPAEGRRSSRVPGLDSLIAAVPERNVLVLFEANLASVPASFKSSAPGATVIAGEPPRGAALLEWFERAAQRSDSRISRRTAQRLAEALYPQTWDRKPNNPRYDRPPDLAHLIQEIEKLALAAHPGHITDEHVTQLISGVPDQKVFRFLDAAGAGELCAALNELDRLTGSSEEPAMVLAQLLGQVELAAVASAAGGRSPEVVARDLGTISAGRVSAVAASTRRASSRPARAVEIGTSTDRRLKSGRIRRPDDALTDIVLGFASDEPGQLSGRSK